MSRAPDAPSGWPSAIAPPSGLSGLGSAPVSASHASGTDANASLTSNAPMSSIVRPPRCSALRVAGIGAVSMMYRVVAGQHGGVHARDRRQPELRAPCSEVVEQQRGGAVADLRAVAGVHHAVRLERRLAASRASRSYPPRRTPSSVSNTPAAVVTGAICAANRAAVDRGGGLARATRSANSSSRVRGEAPALGDHLGADALVRQRRRRSARRSARRAATRRSPIAEPIGTRDIDSTPPATTTS